MLTVVQHVKLVYLVLISLALGFLWWGTFTWLVLIHLFQESWGWASVFLGAIASATTLLGILGQPRTVDWLWRKAPALNWLLAPNLNGEYQLETSSNWPVQKRMLDCIEGRSQSQPPDEATDHLRVTGKLTIRQGLFGIRANYVPDEQSASRSESSVVAASLEARGSDGCFRFHYIYEGRVPNPIDATDGDHYYGAASLRVDENSMDLLIGEYWTNRSWRKGINTAGKALLRRTGHR